MHITIAMTYNLETGKRTSRFVEVFDARDGTVIDSDLPKRLLIPTRLPQEWLPVGLRTGGSGPVSRYFDPEIVFQGGLDPFADGLPSHEERPVIDQSFRPDINGH